MRKFFDSAAGADVLGFVLLAPLSVILWGYLMAAYETVMVVFADQRVHWAGVEVFPERAADLHVLLISLCWMVEGLSVLAVLFVGLVWVRGGSLASCALGVFWRESWAAATARPVAVVAATVHTIEVVVVPPPEPEPAAFDPWPRSWPTGAVSTRVKVRPR